MRKKYIINILGALLIFLAASFAGCALIASYYREPLNAWTISIIVTLFAGITAYKTTQIPEDINLKEGFAIVSLGWTVLSVFGALPFVLSGSIPSFIDALFETMSGFTSTGATILTEIESLPKSILFWRSLTHWYGGMGIVVLSLALFPLIKRIGAMQLFQAEVPGISQERLAPKIATTAKLLWGIYILLTIAETILLRLGGMSLFDSLCHTFGTMGTGGFSTKNASIGAYNNTYFETIIVIFMILGGANFSLHYQALRGNLKTYIKDREFIVYIGLILSVTAIITVVNSMHYYDDIATSFRTGIFQVVSIITTTGYCTADFDKWPDICRIMLVCLMFVGGCAGSTGGGMKIIRAVLLTRRSLQEAKKIIYPQAVIPLKLNNQVIKEDTVNTIFSFFTLYILIYGAASALLCATGIDLMTALTASVACISNIGPGLARVGAVENYGFMPDTSKVLLTLCMLVGRLELYTVIVLFIPMTWKK